MLKTKTSIIIFVLFLAGIFTWSVFDSENYFDAFAPYQISYATVGQATSTLTATVGSSLTLSLDDSSTVALGTISAGTAVTASNRLKVSTNNATGYLITAGRNNIVNSDTLFSSYGGLTIDDADIPAHTTGCTTPKTWAAASTGLGFTIFLTDADNPAKVEACWGSGTTVTDANNKYASFAASASATTIINQADNSPNPQYTSIGYKADVAAAQTATQYNDGSVVYTATTN